MTAAFDKAAIKGKMQIYIDGGIRRGMDIFKALALGATAVGLNLFLFSKYFLKRNWQTDALWT